VRSSGRLRGMADDDPFRLSRFVEAQDAGGTYDTAITELRNGRKVSHWMWFVFPQIAGLGSSPTAREFAISGIDEARAYLGHPVLGPRLLAASRVLLDGTATDADAVFGHVDAMKLRSSMTLFLRASEAGTTFETVLVRFFGGEPDPATDERL
jgi:uncharacterized protein (DUF1810 family)